MSTFTEANNNYILPETLESVLDKMENNDEIQTMYLEDGMSVIINRDELLDDVVYAGPCSFYIDFSEIRSDNDFYDAFVEGANECTCKDERDVEGMMRLLYDPDGTWPFEGEDLDPESFRATIQALFEEVDWICERLYDAISQNGTGDENDNRDELPYPHEEMEKD